MVKQVVDYKKRRAAEVDRMFSSIAPRYDLLNHILSFGLDKGWRRRVASETRKIDCQKILDVCTGTGDMAIEHRGYRFLTGTHRYWTKKSQESPIERQNILWGIKCRGTSV
jgi:hypothetical protein